MKPYILCYFVCIIFIAGENAFGQTASDYYLPLVLGNHLDFYTAQNGNWGARVTTYSIDDTDLVNGKLYFKEKATEVMNETGDSSVFHFFWLCKDSMDNIFMYAFSNSSSDIDSATVANGYLFPNQFLTKGYCLTYNLGDYIQKDSVVSVTENVSVPAGNFANCLDIAESHIDSSGDIIFLEHHYYAKGIGMVKNVRTIPDTEAHTDELIKYTITGVKDALNSIPSRFTLYQNYPNPFNPTTTINYTVAAAGFVTIKVYDILGKELATLVNDYKPAGNYSIKFNADILVSGVYFYKMQAIPEGRQAGSFISTKKFVVLR